MGVVVVVLVKFGLLCIILGRFHTYELANKRSVLVTCLHG